ncbi:PilZ domain-containing protein [Rhodopseudomonas palustris]|uniref:PilZ domain-containing protein n=1 Tax=Rhodopseudomonas palustris TaxID=1076 RepID=UPI002ACE4EF4|nr:PilZ domain-containing protein [Rhodopseudomonas palustris]WQH01161.1 PilZ domain-containing protein [Rhodopseudomonas palustris]
MFERRSSLRRRVYYGGRLAFQARTATIDCVVRNLSAEGAQIEFDNPAAVPDRMELVIARQSIAYLGRIVWRRQNRAGLRLDAPRRQPSELPLDLALRIRATERVNVQLRARLAQLRSEF